MKKDHPWLGSLDLDSGGHWHSGEIGITHILWAWDQSVTYLSSSSYFRCKWDKLGREVNKTRPQQRFSDMRECFTSLKLEKCRSNNQWGIMIKRTKVIRKKNPHPLLVAVSTGSTFLINTEAKNWTSSYDPAITLLDTYYRSPENIFWKCLCAPMFIKALSVVTQIQKQSKYPRTGDWIKETVVHLHSGTLLSCKKRSVTHLVAR